jgi:arginine exporter protein ArgO
MIRSVWTFIIISVVFFSIFFLRPPWTVENVIMGGVPLVFLLFFGYRFWRAKKENPHVLPDDYEDN